MKTAPDVESGAARTAIEDRISSFSRRGSAPCAIVRGIALPERQHHDRRAELDPVVQVDDILVGHADAAGRNRRADVFRLVGAVDAVQRVPVAGEEKRPRAPSDCAGPSDEIGMLPSRFLMSAVGVHDGHLRGGRPWRRRRTPVLSPTVTP